VDAGIAELDELEVADWVDVSEEELERVRDAVLNCERDCVSEDEDD
jgi:hypothetical protein